MRTGKVAVRAMKRLRLLLVLAVGVAGLALGGWWWRRHATRVAAVVPIQDGKTIDFSSGQPVVKDSPADRAAMEKALKEMDEAAKDVTFPATETATKPAEEAGKVDGPKKE